MASNVDKYLTDDEHAVLDHTGIPGVGAGTSFQAQNNGGAIQGPEPTANFIPGPGVALAVVDNPGQTRVDITISQAPVPVGATIVAGGTTLTAGPIQYAGVDSTGGSFGVMLPASPSAGDRIYFKDEGGNCSAEPVTIQGNGNTIDGLADFVMTLDDMSLMLIYANGGWRIF